MVPHPYDWKKLTDPRNQTETNLTLDDGTATSIGLTMTATNCGVGGCAFKWNKAGSELPKHIQSLREVGGAAVARGAIDATFNGLIANAQYRIFVMSTPLFGNVDQRVSITGTQTVQFDQKTGGYKLLVNDNSGTLPLAAYGKVITSKADGTIDIRITPNQSGAEMMLAGLAIQAVSNQVVSNHPVTHWNFDESSGTTAADASSSAINATLFGGASFAGGANSNALQFDGTSGYASIPDDNRIDFGSNEDFTVAVWIQADANQLSAINSDSDVVEKWSGSGGYPFVIRYVNQLDSADSGKIIVARYDGPNNPGMRSTVTIDGGQFHHVAFVKNGSTLSLYINGQLDGTVTDTVTGDTSNNSPLFLNRRGGGTANWFTGAIDDLRIYNTGLSDTEIAQLASQAP